VANQQLLAIQPDVIFVMGKTALNGLLQFKKPLSEIESATWHDIPCIITCHPSSAMRFPDRDAQFRNGLHRLSAFIKENAGQKP
jgi:uracil-DNA glycosylase